MAINTYSVQLFHRHIVGGTEYRYEKVADIKTYPDLGQATPGLETTTTSDSARTYISGIAETPSSLHFTANYSHGYYTDAMIAAGHPFYETYDRILDMADGVEREFLVAFSHNAPDEMGKDGLFIFSGYLDVYITGGGVNEVVEMAIDITPSTPIRFCRTDTITIGSGGITGKAYFIEDYGLATLAQGDKIKLSLDYYSPDGGSVRAGIQLANPAQSVVIATAAAGKYGKITHTFTITAEQADARAVYVYFAGTVGHSVRISDVVIEKVIPNTEDGTVVEEAGDDDEPIPVG